ncbi:MFS transporter [Mumia qirimensis]|uniref:MFS transporter n=1 Tax=Mumia qirimensis TaxID=3234852 RepID=UPI00351D0A7F
MTTVTEKPAAFDRRLLAPIMIGSVLNPINTSIIAVAMVPIATAFGAPASSTIWLVSALYLATAVGQPLAGRLVDTYGPRPVYLAGAVLTASAGLVGTFAPSLGVLVAARVILGLGTCAAYPAAMSLVRSEGDRTGRHAPGAVLTMLAVTTQTVAVAGPALGGLLIDLGSWRATYAINIPLAAACLVLGAVYLPRRAPEARAVPRSLDVVGIALFAVALLGLMIFLTVPRVALVWLPVVAVLAGVAFAVRELRCADPFIDVRVLAGNRPLLATYLRSLAGYTVSYAYVYGFVQWLQEGRGLSPSQAGLLLLPTFVTGVLVSLVTGRRPQIRGKLVVGAVAQIAVSAAILLIVRGDTPVAVLVAIAVVAGLPQGLVSLANQNALYAQADPTRMGSSAGLLRTFGYLGAIVAAVATGQLFGERASTTGVHELAVFMLGAATVFLVLTVLDRSLGRVGRSDRDDVSERGGRGGPGGRPRSRTAA